MPSILWKKEFDEIPREALMRMGVGKCDTCKVNVGLKVNGCGQFECEKCVKELIDDRIERLEKWISDK
jgi:hypothetical protein